MLNILNNSVLIGASGIAVKVPVIVNDRDYRRMSITRSMARSCVPYPRLIYANIHGISFETFLKGGRNRFLGWLMYVLGLGVRSRLARLWTRAKRAKKRGEG